MHKYRSKRTLINDQLRHLYRSRAPGEPAAAAPRKLLAKAEWQVDITTGLIAMRKAGKLASLRIDQSVPRIAFADAPEVIRVISWDVAATLVDTFRNQC